MANDTLTATAPERIWLQIDPAGAPIDYAEPFPADAEGVTWCRDDVGGVQVEYVRADLAGPAPIGADALRVAAYGLIEVCERDWFSMPRHRAAVLKHAAALRTALASAAQPAPIWADAQGDAIGRACLHAWDMSEFTNGECDAVHPMYSTAFDAGYRAALARAAKGGGAT